MGSGTLIGHQRVERDEVESRRILDQICQEFLSRASAHGFTLGAVVIGGFRSVGSGLKTARPGERRMAARPTGVKAARPPPFYLSMTTSQQDPVLEHTV